MREGPKAREERATMVGSNYYGKKEKQREEIDIGPILSQ